MVNIPSNHGNILSHDEVWGEILKEDPDSRTYLLEPDGKFGKVLVSGNGFPFPGRGKYEEPTHWTPLYETYIYRATGEVVCASKMSDICNFSMVDPRVYVELQEETCVKVDPKNEVLIMKFDEPTGKFEPQIISWNSFYEEYDLSILPHKDITQIFDDFMENFDILLEEFFKEGKDEDLLHRTEAGIDALTITKSHNPEMISNLLKRHPDILGFMEKMKFSMGLIQKSGKGETGYHMNIRNALVTQSVIDRFLRLFEEAFPSELPTSISRISSISEQLEWAGSFQTEEKDSSLRHPHYSNLKGYFHDEAYKLDREIIPELFFAGKLVVNGDIDFDSITYETKTRFIERFGEYPEDLLEDHFNKKSIIRNICMMFLKGYHGNPIIQDNDIEFPQEIEELIDIWIPYAFDTKYEFARIHEDYAKKCLEEESYSAFYSFFVGKNKIVRKKVSDFLGIPYISCEEGKRLSQGAGSRALEDLGQTLVAAVLGMHGIDDPSEKDES